MVQKILDNIGNAVVLDAKGMFYAVWDNTFKPLLWGLVKKGKIDTVWLDIIEQVVKSSIDILYLQKETNLLISNGVVNNLFSGIVKGLNTASLIYQGIINLAKLENAMNSLSNISKISKKQAENTMITSFIYEYVYKYNSNIDKMHNSLKPKSMTADTNNFWSIWALFQENKNPNAKKKFYGEWKNYYNVAVKTNEILKKYDINYFNIKFIERIKNTLDNVYLPTINVDATAHFNKKYFIPHNIKTQFIQWCFFTGKFSNMKNVTISIEYIPNMRPFSDLKTIDNTNKKVYVRYLKNPKLNIQIFVKNGRYPEIVENQVLQLQSFYLPGFFDDFPHNYWAMPAISRLFNKEIINGYSDGTFKPEANVTIGEF